MLWSKRGMLIQRPALASLFPCHPYHALAVHLAGLVVSLLDGQPQESGRLSAQGTIRAIGRCCGQPAASAVDRRASPREGSTMCKGAGPTHGVRYVAHLHSKFLLNLCQVLHCRAVSAWLTFTSEWHPLRVTAPMSDKQTMISRWIIQWRWAKTEMMNGWTRRTRMGHLCMHLGT